MVVASVWSAGYRDLFISYCTSLSVFGIKDDREKSLGNFWSI